MEIRDIASLLGRAATDARVAEKLGVFGIDDCPHVTIDENDADGPVVEVKDWVLSARAGVEFGFDDQASWLGLDALHVGRGPMLLTQIYFYGNHPGVAPYGGQLPLGLQIDDDRHAVRSRLAEFEALRRSYVRDTWDLPQFRLIVSYTDAGARIDFVLCMLRPGPLPRLEGPPADYPLPPIDSIIQALGRHWFDPQFRSIFVPLGFDQQLDSVLRGKSANLRELAGLELGFSQFPTPGAAQAAGSGSPVLSYVVFYRDRELGARGWEGTLPLGLRFDDGPEEILRKVGFAPDEQSDDEFSGFALWHLPDYSLHVYYCTMGNVVLRVRIMAPGVWASFKAG
jgi:hypothetical protein